MRVLDGVDDVGGVGMEEGGVGGNAAEDVEEDGGGVCVVRVACGGVEEAEGGGEVGLGRDEFEEVVGSEVFGKVHHFEVGTKLKLNYALVI